MGVTAGVVPSCVKRSPLGVADCVVRYTFVRCSKFFVIEGSVASIDLRTDRKPSSGKLAMMVSVMRLTCAILASGSSDGPMASERESERYPIMAVLYTVHNDHSYGTLYSQLPYSFTYCAGALGERAGRPREFTGVFMGARQIKTRGNRSSSPHTVPASECVVFCDKCGESQLCK